MRPRLCQLLFLSAALVLLAGGCSRDDRLALPLEQDEPHFKQGQRLKNQDRSQEALAEFLKVIAKRSEEAPESHLEAGLIYLQHIKNPIRAIYHFNKYLEQQPNSPQAEFVRGRIDAATREFAKTLPVQPMENASTRLNMLDEMTRLQRENDQLRAELMTLRAGVPPSITRSTGPLSGLLQSTLPSTEYPRMIETAPAESLPEISPPGATQPSMVNPEIPPSGPPQTTNSASGVRTHVVQRSESLWAIGRKYYGLGSNANTDKILQANRDQMKTPQDLRPGMVLKIPPP